MNGRVPSLRVPGTVSGDRADCGMGRADIDAEVTDEEEPARQSQNASQTPPHHHETGAYGKALPVSIRPATRATDAVLRPFREMPRVGITTWRWPSLAAAQGSPYEWESGIHPMWGSGGVWSIGMMLDDAGLLGAWPLSASC